MNEVKQAEAGAASLNQKQAQAAEPGDPHPGAVSYKVSELSGAMLDAAVAKAEGYTRSRFGERNYFIVQLHAGRSVCLIDPHPGFDCAYIGSQSGADSVAWHFEPSVSWAHGGPIIERECIFITLNDHQPPDHRWVSGLKHQAGPDSATSKCEMSGASPLVAAMRAYVKSKFGEHVDV